jgi:uncharacterized lipoprotein YmbA
MQTEIHLPKPIRYLVVIPMVALVIAMSGCGSTDFTMTSIQYPVYEGGRTQPSAITAHLTVADTRRNKSLDHLVNRPVVVQVREQIARDLQSTGWVVPTDALGARYSLQVEIEGLDAETPGYATRSATNALLSQATMGLSNFFTQGAPINVIGHAQLHVIFSDRGNRVVWNETFSGECAEPASMQSAKAHAVKASVVRLALQEAIAKLKARVVQARGDVS